MPPKTLPTRVKVLRGTLRPCRANDAEPQPEALEQLPSPPSRLSRHGKRHWRKTGRALVRMRVLTEADLRALEMYCDYAGRVDEIRDILAEMPEARRYVLRSDGGGYYLNPLFNALSVAHREAMKLAAEFGLTPSSRTKVKAVDLPPKDDLMSILGMS